MSGFFYELKRRKVYRVAIAYVIAAWALAQGLAQILPVFGISNSIIRPVIVLLLIGFPVGLVLAWAYDIRARGIEITRLADEAIAFLDHFVQAVDWTPWEFCGKKLKASSAFVEPIVLTKREIPEEREAAAGEPQKRSLSSSKVSLAEEALMKQYERTRLGGKHEEKPWSQVIRAEERLRLIATGEPGGGKTCATRYTVSAVARESAARLRKHEADVSDVTFPVWIMATDLAKVPEGIDLPDALLSALLSQSALGRSLSPFLRAWLRQRILGARSFIVIDALDEVPSPERNEVFLRRLGELDDSEASILITCRTEPWKQLKECVPWQEKRLTVELKPLDRRDQRKYAEAFFAFLDRRDLTAKMERRLGDLSMREHARTPLILTFACGLLVEDQFRAGVSAATLYRLVIGNLLQGRWRKPESQPPWSSNKDERGDVQDFLPTVAFRLFLESPSGNRFDGKSWRNACSVATTYFGKLFLDQLPLRKDLVKLGFIVDGGTNEEGRQCWSFAHRTMLEFLAAEGLHKDTAELNRLLKTQKPIEENPFWFKPAWLPTLTFLAAIMGDASPLIEATDLPPLIDGQPAPGDDFFGRMFGLKCVFAGVGKLTPEPLVTQLTQDWVRRWESAFAARQTRLCEILQGYARFLVGHPAFIRSVISPLLKRLRPAQTSFLHWHLVKPVANALANLGDQSLVPVLFDSLETESNPDGRQLFVNMLETLGDPSAAVPLLEILRSEPESVVRIRIARALGGLGNQTMIQPLLELFDLEKEREVRCALANAISALGDGFVVEPLLGRFDVEEDDKVRRRLIKAISSTGERSAAAFLLKRLQSEEDPNVQPSIILALGALGDRSALSPLLERFRQTPKSDMEFALQFSVVKALGTLGDRAAVLPLLQRFEAPLLHRGMEKNLDVYLALALGDLGDRVAVPALLQRLRLEAKLGVDTGVDTAIVTALGKLGDATTSVSLLELLPITRSPHLRSAIADAIGRIGNSRAIGPLREQLRVEEDFDACRSLVTALAKCGDKAIDSWWVHRIGEKLRHEQTKDMRPQTIESLWNVTERGRLFLAVLPQMRSRKPLNTVRSLPTQPAPKQNETSKEEDPTIYKTKAKIAEGLASVLKYFIQTGTNPENIGGDIIRLIRLLDISAPGSTRRQGVAADPRYELFEYIQDLVDSDTLRMIDPDEFLFEESAERFESVAQIQTFLKEISTKLLRHFVNDTNENQTEN